MSGFIPEIGLGVKSPKHGFKSQREKLKAYQKKEKVDAKKSKQKRSKAGKLLKKKVFSKLW